MLYPANIGQSAAGINASYALWRGWRLLLSPRRGYAASDKVRLNVANVFVIQEGRATYTIGSNTLEATAGQTAIVPAGTPHKFSNSGSGRLRQVDIHHSPRFITEWLED